MCRHFTVVKTVEATGRDGRRGRAAGRPEGRVPDSGIVGHADREVLYDHFIELARKVGCTHLKATASPLNEMSIRFHTAMGMRPQGEPNEAGFVVMKGHLSPGVDRVVFLMPIA
jgi:hypothetical protein